MPRLVACLFLVALTAAYAATDFETLAGHFDDMVAGSPQGTPWGKADGKKLKLTGELLHRRASGGGPSDLHRSYWEGVLRAQRGKGSVPLLLRGYSRSRHGDGAELAEPFFTGLGSGGVVTAYLQVTCCGSSGGFPFDVHAIRRADGKLSLLSE